MKQFQILTNFHKAHRKICKEYHLPSGSVKREKFSYEVREVEDPTDGQRIKYPVYEEINLIDGTLKYSFNALPVLFALNGHDKNLFIFILTYCLKDDCTFLWNKIVGEHYALMYESIKGECPNYEIIRQSIPHLVKQNVIQQVEPGRYMLNPIFYFGTKKYVRKELLKTYAFLSAKKKPIYKESLQMSSDNSIDDAYWVNSSI